MGRKEDTLIQAIMELGREYLKLKHTSSDDVYSILLEDPNQKGTYPHILVVTLARRNGAFEYRGIRVEQSDRTKVAKYMYRRASPNGPNFSPTTLVSGKGASGSFEQRVLSWFKKYGELNPDYQAVGLCLKRNEVTIKDELNREWQKLQVQREGAALTLAIETETGDLQYLGDMPRMRRLFVDIVLKKYEESAKENHFCSVCGKRKKKVYGDAIPLKFYTLDKPGFIAGGMDKALAWRNAPVCAECFLLLNEGIKLLKDKLTFKMGGQRYFLIPKFLGASEKAREALQLLQRGENDVTRTENIRRISEDEKELLDDLGSRFGDVLTLNFLFFSSKQARFEINLLTEDILPSRLSTIFKAQSCAADADLFRDVKVGKNNYENIQFRFDRFRQFTPSRKAILATIDHVFRGIPLERAVVFRWLMDTIRERFTKEQYLKVVVLDAKVVVLDALAATRFFAELDILPSSESLPEGDGIMTDLKPKAEEFFGKFPETFLSPAHKALFLLGGLAQSLLNIQSQERGSTPFRKRLKGLRMREEDFKALLPQIQNKLEEYGKNYYRKLEELISSYFLASGTGWQLRTDEMNFYFVLGMNLKNKVNEALGVSTQHKEE
mgnify:CR=1 FL=1